mgnify:CR=1 FL=1
MAKEKQLEKLKEPAEVPEKDSFFPKILLIFSILLITLAIVNFFNLFVLPELVANIALLLAGLWMLKLGVGMGVYKKRTGKLKKYL